MRYASLLKLLIVIVVSGFAALTFYFHSLNSSSSAPPDAKETILATSDYAQKLAPNVRLRMSQTPAAENPQVEVLVRIMGDLEAAQRSQLESAGMQIRGLMGSIVVGVVGLRQIPSIAELDFVQYIELSSPVYPHAPP
jgi:hypothetical protein